MQLFYTVDDVVAGALPERARLAVVGNPIAHSLSPPMQQAALDAARVPATYIRLLCEQDEGAFAAMVSALQQAGFVGANVTVPFKKQAFAAGRADALSRFCGAANTLVFRGGEIDCYNTDGPGFARAIHELCGRELHELRVLLLGACGGAGSALAAQCVLSGCRELTLVNRPRPELAAMATKLHALGPQCTLHTLTFDAPQLAGAVSQADLVVNATSIGLAADTQATPLPPEWLRPGQVVYDIVTHETPLVRAAHQLGCVAANGQSMLLWQGALAFEHWFGYQPDVEAMRCALNAASAARQAP